MATATKPTPAPQPEVEYPDSDGKPMSDHTLQFKWIVIFKEGIEIQYADDPEVFVGGNLLWYAVEGKPKIRGAPDIMVAFGRPKGERGSYKQWVEGGIAPQVVFEVLSPGNRPGEMRRKFQFYQKHGVEEYYVYDPFSGRLEGWCRRGRRLYPVANMQGYVSPGLGIRFEPGSGPDSLIVISRDGRPFIAPVEMARRAETAEQRAETAEQRAETAEQRIATAERRAETAEERAERLAARLRALGLDTD